MSKSYFNSMIVGNSAMLGCIGHKGELIRLFWPDIDYPQHIEKLIVGITCPQIRCETLWLHSEEWQTEQYYVEDTNIAVTSCVNDQFGLKITQSDFVLPDQDVLIRFYEAENHGPSNLDIGFTVYSSAVSANPDPACVLYEQKLSALIHYRHDYYYSISSGNEAAEYQLGGNAEYNAGLGSLHGNDVIGMVKDGALVWGKKPLGAGQKIKFALYICMARDLKALKKLTREINGSDPFKALDSTAAYWRNYLNGLKQVNTGRKEIDRLYKRSLLVFALMTNKRTGALLAAPEIDEKFTRCGRYAYCWGRDAAFIAAAMDKVGLHDDVKNFYRWSARVQDEDGSWQQRYHMDGNLAPSWGLQIDEGGSIIHGILKHYEACRDKSFLAEMWPSVRKGVEFLAGYIDAETGLPWLSFDLWEERPGEHAYSTAAVCAGLEAGARIAEILAAECPTAGTQAPCADKAADAHPVMPGVFDAGVEGAADEAQTPDSAKVTNKAQLPDTAQVPDAAELLQLAGLWREAGEKMRGALERNFWKPEWNRFARSVRVKLNAWGEEPSGARVSLKLNGKSIARDYSLLDGTVDISLLGLSVPFGLYPADVPRVEATAQVVEQVLSKAPSGGLMRYENDGYIGGNPWIIATLWAALYHIERKSYEKAREYFEWALKGATDQGLLPEQVDRETGRPAWVIPLTWSHAMFVLVLDALVAAGEL